MTPHRVILVPGSVLPAELAYGSLVAALGSDAESVAKELEVYATAEAPRDYTLDLEVAGMLREADARGVGAVPSGRLFRRWRGRAGGRRSPPERLSSLALLEPAWAGRWELSPAEQALWREYDRLEALPPDEFIRAFMRLNVKPGVELPPPPSGEPPPWMAKRPAGIQAFLRTFRTYDLDRAALARFDRPVYYAIGGLSIQDQYGEIATRLSRVFPDFQLEVFDERHHFDPPHRIEPERLADSLRSLWRRADRAEPTL